MPLPARRFPRLGRSVHPVGFGGWAIGGTWGDVPEDDARAALHAALDAGADFIDTADVYGDGRSERIIAAVLAERAGPRPFVATKAGRRLSPHVAEGYTAANLGAFIDRSRANLAMDRLDLVQLHCPPAAVYAADAAFDAMDLFVAEGRIAAWGVSVETVEEGLSAIRRPGCASVQIIWNMFRQKPAAAFLPAAAAAGVGVIARVPLASGLLTGKLTADTAFSADDHRAFNRDGAAFDKGETFSGVPYDVALAAVEALRPLVPERASMAAWALRWCLMEEAVTVVIPGAKTAAQALANMAAADLPALPGADMDAIRAVYDAQVRPHVHHLW
ncbi:MAG TPA: aldo/keto reductase [Paracoccaceae bacterium]|nr:aldo/keto reductase [Paracoccaceae bacterium]HMO72227.1 aldo/keto reductase [Paracoccaceae bacterium]